MHAINFGLAGEHACARRENISILLSLFCCVELVRIYNAGKTISVSMSSCRVFYFSALYWLLYGLYILSGQKVNIVKWYSCFRSAMYCSICREILSGFSSQKESAPVALHSWIVTDSSPVVFKEHTAEREVFLPFLPTHHCAPFLCTQAHQAEIFVRRDNEIQHRICGSAWQYLIDLLDMSKALE